MGGTNLSRREFLRRLGIGAGSAVAMMALEPLGVLAQEKKIVSTGLEDDQPETNRMTSIHPIAVKADDNKYLVFSYDVKKGEKISYKMVPFAAVAIDKTDNAMQMTVLYLEK